MNLFRLLQAHASAGKPVRVALIGAGKFGSMFLAQVPHTPGLQVPIIVDIDRERAREACRTVGWSAEQIARTVFTDDGARAIAGGAMDVVVEATGNPAVGIRHARAAIAAGKHVVMVNVEADVLAGPLLAEEARKASVDLYQFTHLVTESFSREQRLLLIEAIWGVVYSDGVLTAVEGQLARRIAELLGFQHPEVQAVRERVAAKKT